jgi:phosphatidylserine/phosphatidylglycerophosphate/cardiolipin synthase-like enzyme
MIELEKPFKVYVVTPYYPISFTEVIIKSQYETKKMIFKKITEFINKMIDIYQYDKKKKEYYKNIRVDDYIVYLSLVKVIELEIDNYKEKFGDSLKIIEQNKGLKKLTDLLEKNQKKKIRHVLKQIYVHSKLMIVDDVFLILGSANINYRSMITSRDSEVCLSIFNAQKVKNFRKRIFQTHFGQDVENPNDNDYFKKFYKIGRTNHDNFESKRKMDDGVDYYYIIYDKVEYYNGEIKNADIQVGEKISTNFGMELKSLKLVDKILPIQLFY